jgi:hypothetical protein
MSFLKKYWLLSTSVAGILIISFFSTHIVPLYDGVGFPDEPYRYVKAPKDAKNNSALSPSPASTAVAISGGTNQSDVSLASREQGPQVSIYVYTQALKASSQTAKAALSATPSVSSDMNTPKGPVAGNVYSFGYQINSGSLAIKQNNKEIRGYVDLRLPQNAGANAVMLYRSSASTAWRTLETLKVGNDIYQAPVDAFGDYALVPAKPAGSAYKLKLIIICILTVAVLTLSGLLVVLRRKDKAENNKRHKK